MIRLGDLSRAVYANELRKLGVRVPLSLCGEHTGFVIDADGCEVLVVDANGERPDEVVAAIAALIAEAVNARAGTPSCSSGDRPVSAPLTDPDAPTVVPAGVSAPESRPGRDMRSRLPAGDHP